MAGPDLHIMVPARTQFVVSWARSQRAAVSTTATNIPPKLLLRSWTPEAWWVWAVLRLSDVKLPTVSVVRHIAFRGNNTMPRISAHTRSGVYVKDRNHQMPGVESLEERLQLSTVTPSSVSLGYGSTLDQTKTQTVPLSITLPQLR